MAIPKKGSRKIVVDGYEFVWKFRKRMGHNERHGVDYLIPIQYMDRQILLISTGYNRSDFYFDDIFSVTPSIIEKCIRFSISQGWQFEKKLPPLEIDCRSVLIEEAQSKIMLLIQEIEKNNQDILRK